jgi:hypothetical protein
MKLWPVGYLALPLLNVLARAGLEVNGHTGVETLKPDYAAAVWIGIGVCLAITRMANLAFSYVTTLHCSTYILTVTNKVEHYTCERYLS